MMLSVIQCLDTKAKNPSSQWVSGDSHSLTPPLNSRANKWLSASSHKPRNSCLPLLSLLSPRFVPLWLDQVLPLVGFPLWGFHTSNFTLISSISSMFWILARLYAWEGVGQHLGKLSYKSRVRVLSASADLPPAGSTQWRCCPYWFSWRRWWWFLPLPVELDGTCCSHIGLRKRRTIEGWAVINMCSLQEAKYTNWITEDQWNL